MLPTVGWFSGSEVRTLPLGSTCINPGYDRIDVVLSQPRIIAKLQALDRIRRPWRHFACHNFFLDCLSPRTHNIIRNQRHSRRYSLCTMAPYAVFEKDRCHVFIEGWLGVVLSGL